MEAEFFCMTDDVPRARLMKRLISTYLDSSITLHVHDVENNPKRGELARRYEQLMQASIPPELGLSLSVAMMDWYINRVYIQIYWPILTKGYWSEIEGSSVFFKGYEVTELLSFYRHGGLELFFPALAIRDRMVLMPRGQGKLLEKVGSEKEVEVQYNMHEVNFSDDAALDEAIRLIAQELQQEVRHEVRAYSSFIQGVINVKQAAADLQLPPALLTRAFKEETDAIAAMYQLLSCELGQKTLLQGRWTKTVLVVRNESDKEFREVMVKIAGPVELLPRNIKVDLPAHSTVPIDVSVRPPDPGDFPLEIAFALQEDRALEDWLPVHHIWVESMAP